MPPGYTPTTETNTFTVINNERENDESMAQKTTTEKRDIVEPRINVVKPLKREDELQAASNKPSTRWQLPENKFSVAKIEASAPQTILDPKFTRALDFKLRRLKEKEILQANLQCPIRHQFKFYKNLFTFSNPNISSKKLSPRKPISQSHPRIDFISSEKKKISGEMDESTAPRRRNRVWNISGSDTEKPRFVTTVKSGQFLLPPPEVARLLGLDTLYQKQEHKNIVYSYANRPQAVTNRSKRALPEKSSQRNCTINFETRVGNIGKARVGEVFKGVRALVAGVVGLKRPMEPQNNGSMTTATSAHYSNVMHERRVVRGSTFTSHPHAAGDAGAGMRLAHTRRRGRMLAQRAAAARLRPGTPPPAPGRAHHPIQTDYYLEELFDKGVEMEVGVQTDLFVDRPATPLYVPAKTGADASTQIYPGDLFDFELEVQPILEVLVGKTREQALAEVAQEEELCTLREQQQRFRELRDAERAERQRLAAQDSRLHHEKERRVAEAHLAQVAATEARERAAAAVLVQGYVAELLPSVLAGLRDQGYLMERLQRGVGEEFMPWLMRQVAEEVESLITSRDLLSDIVRDVVEARAELYRAVGEKQATYVTPPESVTPLSEHPQEEELQE